jgi:pimeloyl-ACP methyl ester carboxylesterase
MTQRFTREPLLLAFQERSAFKETYGGGTDTVVLEGQYLRPEAPRGKTALLFMHPTGTMNTLPLPNALARRGLPVLCCGSRYPHNDTALIMEKVVIDLGAYVRYARERLGFEKVVLAGWSGGGSLALFYQAQAEHPTLHATPAGDPVDLAGTKLLPADGVMQLAAHVSRATTLTEWLDPAVVDERDPTRRDQSLDLYDPAGPKPPFDAAFLERFRAAQRARSQRITAWVWERLDALKRAGRPFDEEAFVVHGTMADPRWLDPTVDPNDRAPGQCYMGDPRVVNMMPAGLARYASLRAWLSQWSFETSRADGPRSAASISVPAFVVENSADDACTPSHGQRIWDALAHVPRERELIKGATHYYLGQRACLDQAADAIVSWLERQHFI